MNDTAVNVAELTRRMDAMNALLKSHAPNSQDYFCTKYMLLTNEYLKIKMQHEMVLNWCREQLGGELPPVESHPSYASLAPFAQGDELEEAEVDGPMWMVVRCDQQSAINEQLQHQLQLSECLYLDMVRLQRAFP